MTGTLRNTSSQSDGQPQENNESVGKYLDLLHKYASKSPILSSILNTIEGKFALLSTGENNTLFSIFKKQVETHTGIISNTSMQAAIEALPPHNS